MTFAVVLSLWVAPELNAQSSPRWSSNSPRASPFKQRRESSSESSIKALRGSLTRVSRYPDVLRTEKGEEHGTKRPNQERDQRPGNEGGRAEQSSAATMPTRRPASPSATP